MDGIKVVYKVFDKKQKQYVKGPNMTTDHWLNKRSALAFIMNETSSYASEVMNNLANNYEVHEVTTIQKVENVFKPEDLKRILKEERESKSSDEEISDEEKERLEYERLKAKYDK